MTRDVSICQLLEKETTNGKYTDVLNILGAMSLGKSFQKKNRIFCCTEAEKKMVNGSIKNLRVFTISLKGLF